MRILVIGGGAREHALVWKLHFCPEVSAIYAAPGNAGISFLAGTAPVAAENVEGLRRLAIEHHIDLTVVGPEGPLAAGVVDAFHQTGLPIFGPTQAAARIESSKVWAKELMQRAGVPIPRWASAEAPEEARAKWRDFGLPVVLKADGLARGHGTVVCRSADEVEDTITEFMENGIHGAAGRRIELEEFLEGSELSVFALTDGEHVLVLNSARDYKPLLDGNQGPNTGGMGGYARPADATPELIEDVRVRILEPTVRALAEEGCPYVGVLYAGLVLTRAGPRVIEFNSRWGDPEAQLLLPLLKSDIVQLMLACLDGRLDETTVEWHEGASVGVVLAAAGYPQAPRKGDTITGLDKLDEGILAFHAATRFVDAPRGLVSWLRGPSGDSGRRLVTDGGRILTVVATGNTVAEARARAYASVESVHFEGMHYRRDLGAEEASSAPSLAGRGQSSTPSPPAGEADTALARLGGEGAKPQAPAVAILMGSESDRQVMEETAKVLEALGIGHETHVMSAHRTPERVRQFAREAEARGIRVIVAGAGGAAHLPGALAAQTTLPVVGVPIPGSALMGLDSLLSIVQMPAGVPVATVAVGTAGARNAGYLAAAMIGLADQGVRAKYREFRVNQSGGELA